LGFKEIELDLSIIKEYIKNHFADINKSLSHSSCGNSNIKKKMNIYINYRKQ